MKKPWLMIPFLGLTSCQNLPPAPELSALNTHSSGVQKMQLQLGQRILSEDGMASFVLQQLDPSADAGTDQEPAPPRHPDLQIDDVLLTDTQESIIRSCGHTARL